MVGPVIAIKRDDTGSLDDLFGYTSENVENTSTIEVVSSDLSEVVKEYLHIYNHVDDSNLDGKCTNIILSPKEINSAIQLICTLPEHKRHPYYYVTGNFFNTLIKNSYDAGYNDFNFNFSSDILINELGRKIKATKKRPLKINIIGDVGEDFCREAHFINANVTGNVGKMAFGWSRRNNASIIGNVDYSFAAYSHDCNFKIKGNVERGFAINSYDLDCKILGDVGRVFGNQSRDLNALIKGYVGDNFGAYSKCLDAVIMGNTSYAFGAYSHRLKAVISGHVRSFVETLPNSEIYVSGQVQSGWDYVRGQKGIDASYSVKDNEIFKSKIKKLEEAMEKW
jgi:hypothetical protein